MGNLGGKTEWENCVGNLGEKNLDGMIERRWEICAGQLSGKFRWEKFGLKINFFDVSVAIEQAFGVWIRNVIGGVTDLWRK